MGSRHGTLTFVLRGEVWMDRDQDVLAVVAALQAGGEPETVRLRSAVRATLAEIASTAPGKTVEIRVPPYGAVQAIAGGAHTRGTPRAVVECDAVTWIRLATGRTTWPDAVASGRLVASGERSDLSGLLPLPSWRS